MQRVGLIIALGCAASACSQGVDGAPGLTFGANEPGPAATSGAGAGESGPIDIDDDDDDGDDDDDTGGAQTGGSSEEPPSETSGSSASCQPGDTRSCYSGPDGTDGVGPCRAGTQTCGEDGSWEDTCADEVTPENEACDGADNDCNGDIDDGNPGGGESCDTGLAGPCEPGIASCVDGAIACEPTSRPSDSEVCGNGIDDDCSGAVDDGCSCDPGNPGADCAADESCFPTDSGETVCAGPVGTGTQYSTCDSNSDCAPGFVCVDTGVGSVYCMQWCTNLFDCPALLDDCVFLDPSVFDEDQEWGVCYDGLG